MLWWNSLIIVQSRSLHPRKEKFGHVFVLEAHTIASVVPRFFDGQLPDFNFGSNKLNTQMRINRSSTCKSLGLPLSLACMKCKPALEKNQGISVNVEWRHMQCDWVVYWWQPCSSSRHGRTNWHWFDFGERYWQSSTATVLKSEFWGGPEK